MIPRYKTAAPCRVRPLKAAPARSAGSVSYRGLTPLAAALLLGLTGCSSLHYTGESWSQYYPQPVETTSSRGIERKEIWAYNQDYRTRKCIGMIEQNEVIVAGSRQPRDFYFLYDSGGLQQLGFVTESGEFFRYKKDGTKTKLGDYPVTDLGLKVFYGLPVEWTIRLEPLDPYRG